MEIADAIAHDDSSQDDTDWNGYVLPHQQFSYLIRNITRFRKRLSAVLTELTNYTTEIPYPEFKKLERHERAMVTIIFTILNTSQPSALEAFILKTIPLEVKIALGRIQPTFDDLLALPKPNSDQRDCWLVYFDGTVRWELSGPLENRHRTNCIVRRGKYVGSSVDSRGGGARLDKHSKVALLKRSLEFKQRHHAELCKEGTEANLRILAVFDCDAQIKKYVPIVETIFVVMIGTFVGRERQREHNPQACYDLYDKMRCRAMIPDIDGDGLNGALPIHQGVVGISIGRETVFCVTCQQVMPPNTSLREHSRLVEPGNPLGPRRCQGCVRFYGHHGEERRPRADGKYYSRRDERENHRKWVAAGHPDICGNPACAAPRVPGASFSGWMEDSRCQICTSFLNYQKKKAIPQADIRERQPLERELMSRQHIWTSQEDEILKSASNAGMKFMHIVVEHLPHMTAQGLRERLALLKANERKGANRY